MAALRDIVDALGTAAATGEAVVLATVVRVVGSSYGGVGTRMLVRVDGDAVTTVGLVSGGCLESDLAEHARAAHATGRAALVTYDTRADDDAVWGLGLGCNGLIEVLLEPLAPAAARDVAALLHRAQHAGSPRVLATVIRAPQEPGAPVVGAHALLGEGDDDIATAGLWRDGALVAALAAHRDDALAAGRRGHVVTSGASSSASTAVDVAFEVVTPIAHLVVCGSGPDALPVVQLATSLGWDVTVVDHRATVTAHADAAHADAAHADAAHDARFPHARVVACAEPARVAEVAAFGARSAAVVMSHHFARDAAYVHALLATAVPYVGVLGPRSRTERMLAELASRGVSLDAVRSRLYAPVGLDVGGDGPAAIALAVVAEASAVLAGRDGGHLRERRAPLHDAAR